MRLLFSLTIAAVYGIAVRLLAGLTQEVFSVMSLSFFVLLPFAIGYLTIWLLPYKPGQTATGAFFKPVLVIVVIMVITVLFNVEGTICWIMALPFFAVCAGIAAVVAFKKKERRYNRQHNNWDFEKDKWDQSGGLQISFLLLVPILAGCIEGNRLWDFKEMRIRESVEVKASPDRVWQVLTAAHTDGVKHQGWGIVGLLGFPHHLRTTMDRAAVGGSRVSHYEKGLDFEQRVLAMEPGRRLELAVTTDPSKISAAVMDEHIVIGGEHIKLHEDRYQLEVLPDGGTRVTLTSRFSIRTPFNWYAAIWARWLMSDVLSGELGSLKDASLRE